MENEQMNSQEYISKPSAAGPIIVIILFLLVLVCAGGLVVYNYFPEAIFSPKIMYLKAIQDNIGDAEKTVNAYMNDGFVKDGLKAYNTPYTSSYNVKLALNVDKAPAEVAAQLKMVNEILKTSKITINQNGDVKNEKERDEIVLNVKGNNLLTAEIFGDKKFFGVKVPVIFDKYITVDGEDLDSVYQKFGQTAPMKKLVTNADILKAIKIDKDQAFDTIMDYAKTAIDAIADDKFTFKRGVDLKTVDGSIRCNELALKMTLADMKKIALKVLEKASTDDKMLDMTVGNAMNVMKLFKDAGYSGYENIPTDLSDRTKLKAEINKTIESLKEDIKNNAKSDSNNIFVLTLYVDKGSNILQRKIEAMTKLGDKTETTSTTSFSNYPKADGKSEILLFETESPTYNGKSKLVAIMDSEKAGNPRRGTMNISSSIVSDGKELKPFEAKVTFTNESVKNKSIKINSDFDLISDSGYGEKANLKGKLNVDSERKADSSSNSKIAFEFTAPAGTGNQMGIALNVDGTMKYGGSVNIPVTNANNSINLNKATQEELQAAFQSIQMGLKIFAQQNANLFTPSGM